MMIDMSLPKNHTHPGIQFQTTHEKGAYHPPSQSADASPDTASILAYSPMKNIANFIDEYSVWNPAISSDSASGKSNGARFVSATIATRYMHAARKPGSTQ